MKRPSPLLARASLRYLLHHRWQALLALSGIALGVAVVLAVDLAKRKVELARMQYEAQDALAGFETEVIGAAAEAKAPNAGPCGAQYPAVTLAFAKKRGTNAVAVADDVLARLEHLREGEQRVAHEAAQVLAEPPVDGDGEAGLGPLGDRLGQRGDLGPAGSAQRE